MEVNGIIMVVILILVILVFLIAKIRSSLKQKAELYSEKLNQKPLFIGQLETDSTKVFNNHHIIRTDLDVSFKGQVISAIQKKLFLDHYTPYFIEAQTLVNRLSSLRIAPPETVLVFISDYKEINKLVKEHNEKVIGAILDYHKSFFDHCLKYPLDSQQRRSIVSEEDNCLVVSSAGSGKTSSIVGKVKYLTEIKNVPPERILLISYTNKAAAELTVRMGTKGLNGYTFHKLAIDIIGKSTGIKPSICDNTDAVFVSIYKELLNELKFKKSIVEYFLDYQIEENVWDKRKQEKLEQLSELKNIQLKAMFPDMDGKDIYVKSAQEQKICFILSSLDVKFRYEEPYEHQLADETHSQYHPDFSIYFESDGVTKRIYLEHFGTDEHGLVPTWFAKDKNISYEEANEKYNDGITWKIEAHKKFGTELLVTSSADFQHTDISKKLKTLLTSAGVPIKEKTEQELYDLILPKNSKREKAFIRLIATFVTLVKSNCKSIEAILQKANYCNDKRSSFIIEHIFLPVNQLYTEKLKEMQQIDFTDAIIQATEICKNTHPVEYDYIIVDEFQDISMDRYNFLKVLRESNPPAKLYCVGDDWQSIYRFSGSDMSLFNNFTDYFGETEINKIETTYRFGEPLVSLSSMFIQKNRTQFTKDIHPFNPNARTELLFYPYNRHEYCKIIADIINSIPVDESIFLLGRYSFDDYYLSLCYQHIKERDRFYYMIEGRKIEFLTVHKSKGLEADNVILLQCNKDTYGFPSLVSDDPVLNYVLTDSDQFPYGEERRLFYVAITRAKIKTIVLYDKKVPSVFVNEFIHPENVTEDSYLKHRNANKKWTRSEEEFMLMLHNEGKSIKYISGKMGRSQTSIIMRLAKFID